ncbi:2,3-diphosphoglycerate-dependent phosphoglycerate mutase [Candidatus Purcelliella pentastirinorum]|uniref:2,3-diphosphoglycerate-dependent phosphoglycerate mutase n=1 Tax=Candidatus Purcelliella pentastirinorum TaxID=472834 RepID=UPI002367757E|nr:2,3-diphosphoglycerate-dependent phosphoglycerate mutase [Candidatus Purcelliella pentastirinorum]WDI78953.1 2,3-diphosphoglycerate-dependent phosphoglycerate mutase [Candidatus Purcelliella pentastirinorum]WDR80089.1 2,3-diphosphoglycerate-dependent phosphoglycerate mutase [Candidatus Purcelliella pentastirinorum]
MKKNKKIILIRHGESIWNKENKFTGWQDIDLSENGIIEAKKAGNLLKKKKYFLDVAYTSMLTRAIHTLWIILKILNQVWLPVYKTWRLNERHYGNLEGMNKDEIKKKYGIKQVHSWRRSLNVSPPKMNEKDKRFFTNDIRYKNLKKKYIPNGESLSSTIKRIIPYWEKNIINQLKKSKCIIIVAHGNSLRSLIKYINNLNENQISELNIPTGVPIIYEFSDKNQLIKNYYLK